MSITATISYVIKTGDATAGVGVTYSDGSKREFAINLPTTAVDIRTTIKAEVTRLNTVDAQIVTLQAAVGSVIT